MNIGSPCLFLIFSIFYFLFNVLKDFFDFISSSISTKFFYFDKLYFKSIECFLLLLFSYFLFYRFSIFLDLFENISEDDFFKKFFLFPVSFQLPLRLFFYFLAFGTSLFILLVHVPVLSLLLRKQAWVNGVDVSAFVVAQDCSPTGSFPFFLIFSWVGPSNVDQQTTRTIQSGSWLSG